MIFRVLTFRAFLFAAIAGIAMGQTGSPFVYQVIQGSSSTAVSPGGTVTFPGTGIGQTGSLSIRVSNASTSSAAVNSVNVSGQGFQLGGGLALPQVLAPNTSLLFTITFSPSQPSTYLGVLTVNSDTFGLSASGLGSRLGFSYFVNGTEISLASTNNSVIFSPVVISGSTQLDFQIKNSGTLPAIIANIGVGQTNSPFSISGLPSLPLTVAPNSAITMTITYAPTTLGFSNGTLIIDANTITLVGSGTQPPPLPTPSISGPSGAIAPMSQPRVGVSLASPYPVAVSGTLTLTTTGELPGDPAVQFSSGGRTVSFVIPANTTDAVFGTQGTRIGLQSGTVASTVTLTAAFLTQSGNVDLTPKTPPTLQFTIAPAAPVLTSIQLGNQTTSGFSIAVTGFTTSRSLTSWNLQFTPSPGVSLATSQFKINIQQIASVWYRTASSQTFGSLFTMTIPINFSGTPSDGRTLANSIASVAVTLENEQGTSNSLSSVP